MEYLLWNDVQNRLNECYCAGQKGISFYHALKQLFLEGACCDGETKLPDFSLWDAADADRLYDLFLRMPVTAEPLDRYPHTYSRQDSVTLQTFANQNYALLPTPRRETVYSRSDCYSVHYILRGSAMFIVQNCELPLSAGNLSIVTPDTDYMFNGGGDCVSATILIQTKSFDDTFMRLLRHDNILSEFYIRNLSENSKKHILFQFPDPAANYALIRELFCEYYSPSEYQEDICKNLIELLFLRALKSCAHYDKSALANTPPEIEVPILLQYIHENHAGLTLESFSSHFGYNASYISKKLKTYTGKSFHTLLTEERLSAAKYLLIHTSLSVGDIAYQVGYSFPSNFSGRFYAETGMYPKEYRAKHQT